MKLDISNTCVHWRTYLSLLFILLVNVTQIGATCTTCSDNKLTNGGFNSNTTGWTSVNGTFYSDNVYPQCGTAQNGLIQRTTTTGTTQFYQDVSGLVGGSTVKLTFWAGVHNSSYDTQFGMEFYNGSNTTMISQLKEQIDYILGGSPSMQFYTINVTLPSTATRIRVIGSTAGGTSNNWLKVDEVCLNVTNICANFKSLVTAEANLVKTRTVTNEVNCNSGAPDRVLWLDCILDNSSGGTSGNLKYWKIISGGTFKEYCDGTATLTMRVQNVVNSNYKFDVSIIFTGRTYTAPSGSPHLEGCTSASTSNWYYYTTTNGTMTGVDGLAGALLSFSRKGGSFQLGTNASLYGTTGTFGASGWLMYEIITQPAAFNLKANCDADINFFLSGGNLTSTQASTCGSACATTSVLLTANVAGGKPNYTYSWSGGGTGQTKTVNPSATSSYTVTVTDALGCTSTDVVTLTVVDCCTQFVPTITGSNGICADNLTPTTLTATGGVTYAWSTGQTTAAISVAPTSTTTYSVTVTSADGCVKSATKTVNVIPCEGEICFSGNNNVSATANWVITYSLDPVNDKVKIRATLSKNFVDNTYGTNAIGWPNGHTFSNLTGSDQLQLSLLDANNVKKMEFKMDYLTSSSAAPSGYKSLGVTGGDGSMILGSSSDVLSVLTSLDVNFNQYGYVLTTNSPATNSSYAPNATYPNWIFDVWYEVEVKLSAFGSAGFGKVGITGVHASPSKTGNNTETVTEGPCPDPCDSFVPTISGSSGLCSDNIVPTTLTASGGGSYIWNTGQTTASISVAPSSTTTYSVTVTSPTGCVKSASKTVNVIPCEGEICFSGNNNVSATAKWVITYALDPANNKVKIRATLSKNFVDNTYGTNAIGWPNGHTFGNLTGSDQLQLSLLDANNVKKMEFKMDYLTSSSAAPSGYKSLGVTGGDGSMILGSSSDVLSVLTSLDVNFNQYGYILTTNSPATNSSYAPNATYPNWIFDVWYEVEVKLSAFGSAGFGKVGITGVHASPSKTGNNTEIVTEVPCCEMEISLGNNAFICSGGNVSLTPTITDGVAPYKYVWSTGQTTGTISFNATTTQTYTVTVTDKNGCTDTASKMVTVYQLPVLSAGEDLEVCKGTPSFIISVSASGGQSPYTYAWPNGGTGNSQMVSPTVNTTYVITVTDANGCQDTDDIHVTIIPGPTVNVGPDINLCMADEELINSVVTDIPICGTTGINDCNHTLQGTTGWIESASTAAVCGDNAGAKLWTRSSTSNPASSLTLDFGAVVPAGTVICVRMKLEHCSNTTSSVSDAKIQRSLSSGSGYTDVIASKTFSTQSYTEYCYTLSTDTRYVKVIDNGKCAFRVDYVKYQTPDTYNNSIDYLWSGPGIVGSKTGPSIIVNQGGTYVLVVTDCSGCTASDAVNVNINGDVNADAGPDKIICTGTSATLTAVTVAGASYEWRTTDSPALISQNQSITVSPTQNTTYILKVIKNGCEDTDAVDVIVNARPSIAATASPTSICVNGTSILNATASGGTAPYTFNWSGSLGSGEQKSVSPLVTTTYTVTVSDFNGCTASTSVSVSVNQSPSVTVTAVPDVICKNSSSTLTASGSGGTSPYIYSWSDGLGSGTTKNVTPLATKSYFVTVSDANGCTATGTVQVTVKSLPDNSGINGPDEVCADEFSVFTANPPIAGATYFWDFNGGITTDGDTDDVSETVSWPSIFKNSFRTVTLTVTKDNCPFTYTKQVYVKQGPFLNTPGSYDVCQGGSVQIGPNPNDPNQVTPGSTFLWTPNLFLNNNTVARPVSSPPFDIIYTLTATINGCVETKQVLVNVDVNLNPIADAGPDRSVCFGSSVQIGGNPTATPPPGGAIQGVVWIPAAGLNNPLLHNPTASPTVNSQYQVIVVATSGCADTATMNLTVLPKPSVTLTASPSEICSGTSTILTATPSGGTQPYSIQWSNALGAGTTKTVSPVINTSYMVTVTDFSGCTASSAITVVVNTRPSVNVSATPTVICAGESSTLQATGIGGTSPYNFEWSNALGSGATKVVSPLINTTYTVTITDAKGCINTNTVTVTVEQKAKVGDFVWHDLNGNGKQDAGESGLNGVTVTLFNALTNNQVASTTTVAVGEEDGYYEFEVCKGTYYIIFGNLPTYLRTIANVPADDTKDSDADVNTGRTPDFVLNPGDNNRTVDAGYYKLASIGDFVWFDANANGIQDMGEIGVSGIQVNLTGTANDGTPVNSSQATNGSGLYLFTNLKPGVYTVQVVKPVEYLFSPANVGGDDTKDSDSDPGTGIMSSETLTSGEDNRTYDAGLYPSINLEIEKTFIGAVQNFNGTFDVTYRIDVSNLGGPGQYDLTDNQGFDSDIIVNSASYTSTAPGNPGSPLLGSGTWTLANDQPIAGFGTHTYTLVVNVTLNLTDNIGNNVYTACSGQTPVSGQGLYNKAKVYVNDILKDEDDACGDLPNVNMVKNFVGVTPNPNGSYNVTYMILVNNNGGASGRYNLKDTPLFDNDVTILSGNFTGQANGVMNTFGSTTLATNTNIPAGATHIYTVTFTVTLNLEPGSPDGGDNQYTPCAVSGNGPGSGAGQGLYNKAELDRTGDGITDITDDACGDLPYITMRKDFVNVTPAANGTYNVTYQIIVGNTGGATGMYSLKDTPLFDSDVVILSGTYSGQANGNMNTGGSTSLATGVSISANGTHIYTVTFNVRLQIEPGSNDPGNNIYTPCAVSGNGPGSGPGQGLYNRAELDRTGDGITDITDDACGDLPNVTLKKDFVNVVPLANGTYNVTYQIIVGNTGGATGTYSLKDTPLFDSDVVILSGTYSGQANGNMNTGGSTTLANGVSISANDTHIYTVTFNVRLQLEPGSNDPGNNIYTPCAVSGNGPGSGPGQGLYNRAELDKGADGTYELEDDACGDLPNIAMKKDLVNVTSNANGTYRVVYSIVVNNNGGASGNYTLTDSPLFDDDVTITAWDYTFVDVLAGIGNGPAFIGSPSIPINLGSKLLTAGNTHIYTIGFDITLNLEPGSPDGGNNIYTPCEVPGNGPGSTPRHGLYNKAELDKTGDGITDITDDACGDVPNVTMRKDFVNVTPAANGTYNVTYQIIVGNTGGATGMYSLKDTPLFDSDVVILSGTYSGQANGNMNTVGSTTLATGVSIAPNGFHIYTVTFNVRLQLEPGSNDPGNNIYTPCAVSGNGPGSGPGQGLYNRAELDRTGDGITDITDDACGDLPNITLQKDLVNVISLANGTYNVSYRITVGNTGGVAGTYSLKDTPLFDNDVTILSGSFTGQANGNMNTVGSTVLATNVSINAGATHTYNVTFNVSLNLAPGSADGGDNLYTACAVYGDGPGSSPGQGLYNRAELDKGADGSYELQDDACGDLPNINMSKNFVGVTKNANGTYNVSYAIVVNNNGGANGMYTLKDTPLFDNDITILSGNFSGVGNGSMNTSGFTLLANNTNIGPGITHIYTVTFVVRLNLTPGSPDGGDNIYTPCAVSGDGPGSGPGQGLYNLAELDKTGDGISDIYDDACGDLPNVTLVKNFVNVTPNALPLGSYKVTYNIVVTNNGGAQGSYSLQDTPLFDNDVVIHSGTYTGQANGNMNTGGSTLLANNVSIPAGSTHTYTVMFIVTLNLDPNSQDGGDNVYTKCEVPGNGPGSAPRQGLYNRADLDWTGDNIPDLTDDACGDLPGSIGDFVWEDSNANGIQDGGEPGIPNVLVRLFNQSGVQINSMLTGPTGYYLFKDLPEGFYSVGFARPFGYQSTLKDVGTDNNDSDADVVTGLTAQLFLNAGEQNLTVDAGYYRLARIGDFVWEDRNVNGIQDPFEPGIEGVTVNLNGTDAKGAMVNLSTSTNGTGMYEFNNLIPGNYVVTFVKPGSVYLPTLANVGLDDTKDSDANIVTGQSPLIVLNSGDNNTTIDAGFYRCAKVGDFVWLDNGTLNDVQDANDTGLNGIVVELYSTLNTVVPYETQTTRNSPKDGKPGYYLFECMPAGEYFIRVRKPDQYLFVTPNQGGDDEKDSDIVDFLNEKTLNFTVSYAQIIEDIDIGFKFKPLPVNLTKFAGHWNKVADINELAWETASEINSDYFEIQRSFKGSSFEPIGKITAAGNSNRLTSYDFDDKDIKLNGVYSYRLRQVDFDGTETYSNIVDIVVERIGKTSALIYPNPAVGLVNIDLQLTEGSKVFGNIYDQVGRLVLDGIINEVTEVTTQSYSIDVTALNPGVYTIMLNVDGLISSYKLIVLK